MLSPRVKDLLLQSLEHERGGVLIYETALECVVNEDLSKEWEKYLEQTENHVAVLTRVCEELELDPAEMTPGCQIVQQNGKALVAAMKLAQAAGDPTGAEIVACECVVLAETKDHADWDLIGACAKELDGDVAETLLEAYEEVEDEEDEHLYHTKGWCRELWLSALGLEAVLPPPEEEKKVKTAIGAEKAKKAAHPAN
jgi:rubrerythrin